MKYLSTRGESAPHQFCDIGYTKDSDSIPTVAVTITYSKNRLNLYLFKYAKLDMDTIYTELNVEESIYLYPIKQEIRFDVIQDINGNWVEVMPINMFF